MKLREKGSEMNKLRQIEIKGKPYFVQKHISAITYFLPKIVENKKKETMYAKYIKC